MRRRARPEVVLPVALLVALTSACSAPHAPEHVTPSGWYAHPNARWIGVRVSAGQFLFLGKYDVQVRGPIEYVQGICFEREDAVGGSPELRTSVEVEPNGATVLVEETNRPGECMRTPNQRVTRTKLEPITDPARVADLEAKTRPFFDESSCKRYESCCADTTRENWDVHCETRRKIPYVCWTNYLIMNEDRPCP